MVGSAILRLLKSEGYYNLIYKTSKELDLRNQAQVNKFFEDEKPDYVFLAAAKVGGIKANNENRAEFIYDNIMIESNIINAAHVYEAKKLLFFGSSCIYPRNAKQPIKEEYILTGELEHTNKPYALAKLAGVEMCESYSRQYQKNFISVMPTNLYGYGDNYDLNTSHVLPALIRKIYSAKINNENEVVIWGDGTPLREFLHVDDLARASLIIMEDDTIKGPKIINIGSGQEIKISELAKIIALQLGFTGKFSFDNTMPNGTPRKLLDSEKIRNLGWKPEIDLIEGINLTINHLAEIEEVVSWRK